SAGDIDAAGHLHPAVDRPERFGVVDHDVAARGLFVVVPSWVLEYAHREALAVLGVDLAAVLLRVEQDDRGRLERSNCALDLVSGTVLSHDHAAAIVRSNAGLGGLCPVAPSALRR